MKYGADDFTHELLATSNDRDELCRIEIEAINEHQTTNSEYGYNILLGGQGSLGGGRPLTDEEREYIRQCSLKQFANMTEEEKSDWQKKRDDGANTPENKARAKAFATQQMANAQRNKFNRTEHNWKKLEVFTIGDQTIVGSTEAGKHFGVSRQFLRNNANKIIIVSTRVKNWPVPPDCVKLDGLFLKVELATDKYGSFEDTL
jgi:hypothetical protein